ncbi:MAG TPA: acetyl-CoA carboxylase biotin carboxyl carrier protein [Candidatus Acidoferrales bacterium]|nr:acetyl-CoA carboxylase biotin carboxyl carrier protein [Candidatus Acidoferrales bacterium]
MELSEDDVLHILKLIDESKFDYFQLEVGELKITVSKGEPIPISASPQSAAATQIPAPALQSVPVAPAPAPLKEAPKPLVIPEGMVAIKAPMVGVFYVAPEPGKPPFVTVDAVVKADTTVGLIEVMKVFNAVSAGVNGVVTAVLAQNGQLVEYGQPLFLVKPS